MKIDSGKQRLLFQGKQLEDTYSLYDYDVKVNDIIQLIVRSEKMPLGVSQADNIPEEKQAPGKKVGKEEVKEVVEAESDHYKVGHEIDVKNAETGAWFEAVIEKITANDDVKGLDNLTYHVKYVNYGEEQKVILQQLRPRAKRVVDFMDITPSKRSW